MMHRDDCMDLEEFKTHIESLNERESEMIRERYVKTFVDTTSSSYQHMIQERQKFSDGYCYIGYLWDYLKNPIVVRQEYLERFADSKNVVYVLWDIHSCDRIFVKNYWKFGKNTVLKLALSELLKGKKYLPEDIYIFDDTFSWTFVMTHEDVDGVPYCLKAKSSEKEVGGVNF